ncbi:B3 domain-containing protein Os01g0723500-like [Vitis riparia]|uniref:B3 domain-containing protein Os01g0723500-like n=1 Tax=Vitis riparia TaxID=96939 RepID=UPI00155A552A|nr:B3 domain-containing protein Os01g0723500-like [Vitis riparia]
MARGPRRNPSFFKVLIGDFTSKLRIPPAFMKKFRRMTFNNAVLKTITGESWMVSVKQEDSCYFFKKGWKKFVKDQHLEAGDFLVFWFLGDSTFQVVVYDKSGCEKDPNLGAKGKRIGLHGEKNNPCMGRYDANHVMPATSVAVKMESKDQGADKVAASGRTKHPQFVKVLKKYHDYVMLVPRAFAEETGMRWNKSTLVRDPEGRVWPVKVCLRSKGKIEMSSGWSDFVKANKLGKGDTCSFQCTDATCHVIQVEILRRAAIP